LEESTIGSAIVDTTGITQEDNSNANNNMGMSNTIAFKSTLIKNSMTFTPKMA
jgi:hypothetical protein